MAFRRGFKRPLRCLTSGRNAAVTTFTSGSAAPCQVWRRKGRASPEKGRHDFGPVQRTRIVDRPTLAADGGGRVRIAGRWRPPHLRTPCGSNRTMVAAHSQCTRRECLRTDTRSIAPAYRASPGTISKAPSTRSRSSGGGAPMIFRIRLLPSATTLSVMIWDRACIPCLPQSRRLVGASPPALRPTTWERQ